MTSALLAAVLLVCAAAATRDLRVAAVEPEEFSDDADLEDDGEGDFAPFMIVVEHLDGWRCAGSLVSLRTALTSAWCARGRGAAPARELWALAAGAADSAPTGDAAVAARLHGARRIARVAVATGADAEVSEGTEGTEGASASWRGGAMDLAVVELEEPFGSAARAQPILMATTSGECAGSGGEGQCHVSRAIPQAGGGGGRSLLRIVSADLAPPDRCARAANFWNTVRDRALCFVGPELCASDWGGSLVCGGKLCGVVSRSVRASGGEGGKAGAGDDCGDTHAAQSLAQWRRFLHCAHTLRACGRGGHCEDLCIERRLVDEPSPPASVQPTATNTSPTTDVATKRPTATTVASVINYPTRTGKPRRRPLPTPTAARARLSPAPAPAPAPVHAKPRFIPPAPTPAPAPPPRPVVATADTPAALRPSFEFEPNRADFKAGEYGDNAAEYGDEEAAPPPATRTPAPPAPPAGVHARTREREVPPPTATPPRPDPAVVAYKPVSDHHAPKSKRAPTFMSSVHPLLILVPFIYIFMAI